MSLPSNRGIVNLFTLILLLIFLFSPASVECTKNLTNKFKLEFTFNHLSVVVFLAQEIFITEYS